MSIVVANTLDIEARFRTLSSAEEPVAQALLDDAWVIVKSAVPDIETRISTGVLDLGVATFVVCAMVLRVLRNPDGVRQWSVDDYSETRDSVLSGGVLYVSDAEADLLTGRNRAVLPRAMSVQISSDVEARTDRAPYLQW